MAEIGARFQACISCNIQLAGDQLLAVQKKYLQVNIQLSETKKLTPQCLQLIQERKINGRFLAWGPHTITNDFRATLLSEMPALQIFGVTESAMVQNPFLI